MRAPEMHTPEMRAPQRGSGRPQQREGGRTRLPRTDRLTSVWLCGALLAAVVTIIGKGLLPQPLWTTIHLVTLGVLTNGIFQWSWYFTRTLLHLPPGERHSGRDNTVRIVSFNVALVALIACMWVGFWPGVVVGATVVALVASWHGLALILSGRGRLRSRFAVILRFYIAASAFLVCAACLAGFVAVAMLDPNAPDWLVGVRDSLTVAHALSGVVGWVGLTIGGTLVTLGPTALRTRIDSQAVPLSTQALPAWVAGLLIAIVGALLGQTAVIGWGLVIVALAAGVGVAFPLARSAARKGPSEYASHAICAGVMWLLVGLIAVAVGALVHPDTTALRTLTITWLPLIGAGGAGQVFIGALSYLMPVVIGGGPSVVRTGIACIEVLSPWRLATRQSALALLAFVAALPQTPAVTTALGHPGSVITGWGFSVLVLVMWLVVLGTYLADVVLLARAGIAQIRAKASLVTPVFPAPPPAIHRTSHALTLSPSDPQSPPGTTRDTATSDTTSSQDRKERTP
ncbi:hypothetical protein [Schaalia sp. ZJ1691]|uniref:hypothetical protein n=1 Tax=Schaalia sp. ZJ1691 TaxID=2709404 RepID=UPI001F14CC09|nr:hypothetical protein [Schaalia sp. ZJ1691]